MMSVNLLSSGGSDQQFFNRWPDIGICKAKVQPVHLLLASYTTWWCWKHAHTHTTEILRSLVHVSGTVCQRNCVSQTSNWKNFDGYLKRFCLSETLALSDYCFWVPYKYSATTTNCFSGYFLA